MKSPLRGSFLFLGLVLAANSVTAQERIESWTNKTVMIVTPHPDDDLFGCGGTIALLAKNRNRILVVIYTNDNKGSYDLEMTSERLARIRKAEEEAACTEDVLDRVPGDVRDEVEAVTRDGRLRAADDLVGDEGDEERRARGGRPGDHLQQQVAQTDPPPSERAAGCVVRQVRGGHAILTCGAS